MIDDRTLAQKIREELFLKLEKYFDPEVMKAFLDKDGLITQETKFVIAESDLPVVKNLKVFLNILASLENVSASANQPIDEESEENKPDEVIVIGPDLWKWGTNAAYYINRLYVLGSEALSAKRALSQADLESLLEIKNLLNSIFLDVNSVSQQCMPNGILQKDAEQLLEQNLKLEKGSFNNVFTILFASQKTESVSTPTTGDTLTRLIQQIENELNISPGKGFYKIDPSDSKKMQTTKSLLNAMRSIAEIKDILSKKKNPKTDVSFYFSMLACVIHVSDYLALLQTEGDMQASVKELLQMLLQELGPILKQLVLHLDQAEEVLYLKEGIFLNQIESVVENYQKVCEQYEILVPEEDKRCYEKARHESRALRIAEMDRDVEQIERKVIVLEKLQCTLEKYSGDVGFKTMNEGDRLFILESLDLLSLDDELKEVYVSELVESRKTQSSAKPEESKSSEGWGSYFYSWGTAVVDTVKSVATTMTGGGSRHSEILEATIKAHDNLLGEKILRQEHQQSKRDFLKNRIKAETVIPKLSLKPWVIELEENHAKEEEKNAEKEKSAAKKDSTETIKATREYVFYYLENFFDEAVLKTLRDENDQFIQNKVFSLDQGDSHLVRNIKWLLNVLLELEGQPNSSTAAKVMTVYLQTSLLDSQDINDLYAWVHSLITSSANDTFTNLNGLLKQLEINFGLSNGTIQNTLVNVCQFLKSKVTEPQFIETLEQKESSTLTTKEIHAQHMHDVSIDFLGEKNEEGFFQSLDTDNLAEKNAKSIFNALFSFNQLQEGAIPKELALECVHAFQGYLAFYRDIQEKGGTRNTHLHILGNTFKIAFNLNESHLTELISKCIALYKELKNNVYSSKLREEFNHLMAEFLKIFGPFMEQLAIYIDNMEESAYLKQGLIFDRIEPLFTVYASMLKFGKVETEQEVKSLYTGVREKAHKQRCEEINKQKISLQEKADIAKQLLEIFSTYENTALHNIPADKVAFILKHLSLIPLGPALTADYKKLLEACLVQNNHQQQVGYVGSIMSGINSVIESVGNSFGWTCHSEVVDAVKRWEKDIAKENAAINLRVEVISNRDYGFKTSQEQATNTAELSQEKISNVQDSEGKITANILLKFLLVIGEFFQHLHQVLRHPRGQSLPYVELTELPSEGKIMEMLSNDSPILGRKSGSTFTASPDKNNTHFMTDDLLHRYERQHIPYIKGKHQDALHVEEENEGEGEGEHEGELDGNKDHSTSVTIVS